MRVVETWTYDYATGFRKTDPDGRVVDVKFTPDGYVDRIVRGGTNQATTRYTYSYSVATDLPGVVTETSPSGVRTTRRYDRQNRLVRRQVEGIRTEQISREYKADRTLVETVVDETGYEVVRERNFHNQITTITFPDDTTESYSYEPRFRFVSSFTDRNGITETYHYDGAGNFVEKKEAVGTSLERQTLYDRDSFGRLEQTTWQGGTDTPTVTNAWTYDADGNIATFTDGEGNVEHYQDYDVTGNYHTLVDGGGHTWLLDYDEAGNLVSLTNPLGKTTTLSYDGAGNLTASTLPTQAQTVLAYDGQARLNQVTDALGNTTELAIDDTTRTLTVTDARGNSVQMTQNPFDQIERLVDPTGNVTTLTYDARQLARINFPTFEQRLAYDENNRIDQVTNLVGGGASQVTRLDYDAVGNLIETLDAEDNAYRYTVDALGRIATITDPLEGTIEFAYDRRGNLTLVRDPEGRETRFEYNGNDQLTAEVIGTAPDTTRREYSYDGNGNLTAIITPAGGRITFTYNAAGQLTASAVYPDTTTATPEKTITFGRDDIGRLTSYSDGTTSASYTYDAVDRVTAVTTDFGGFSKTYAYTYYDNGWIKTYESPEGVTYTYSYHADGTLTAVNIPGEGQITLADYAWLAPQTMTLPGGTTVSASYDPLLRLDSYTVTDPAGQTIASGIYSYDRVNNILGIVTEDDTKDYGYDDLYRLTRADFTQLDDEAYSYDGVGNRLSSANDPVWQYNDKTSSSPTAPPPTSTMPTATAS
ncbi:MAG: hypothetical protein U5O39_04985 [Gammaproteobacteria bacterium]|nr:hypothetical protein [Gammaproteobacteria bacterium]